MKILYFAWIRQRIGKSSDDLALPEDVKNVQHLIDHLKGLSAGYAAAFQDLDAIKVAVNQEQVGFETPITAAQEIAFFPPVTGG